MPAAADITASDTEDIRRAYSLFRERAETAVVSVCEAEHSPLWCGHLPDNQEFVGFIQPDSAARRQAGGRFYRLNGAIYIISTEAFRRERFFYHAGSFAYIMPRQRSIDIDTEMDFRLAEFFLRDTE